MHQGGPLMSRMQSPQDATARVTFTAPEDVVDRLDDLVDAEDYESRSALLRDMVREEVGADADDAGGDYLPAVDVHRAVYEAALDYSLMGKPVHVLRLDLYRSQLAQEAGVSTPTVDNILYVLQGAGYVRRLVGNPGDQVAVESWRVKPRCADPEQWKHRKQT